MSDEFNFLKDKRLIEAFRREKPYIVHLEKIVKKMGYGRLTVVFRVHNEQVTDLTVFSGQKIRYDLSKKEPPKVEPLAAQDFEKEVISNMI